MHRYLDPWAWGAAAGITWDEADQNDPPPTDSELQAIIRERPDTIAVVRYDANRPPENLAAHCALTAAGILRVGVAEIERHTGVRSRAIEIALAEFFAADGPEAIRALPYPVWSRATYHAWMMRELSGQRVHVIPRAR